MYKQVIMVRQDLKLPKGKLAVQVAHACVESALNSDHDIVDEWRRMGAKKVVVKVKDLEELEQYYRKAKQAKFTACKISDAGKTVLAPGTVTCACIGPAREEQVDTVTGSLKIL